METLATKSKEKVPNPVKVAPKPESGKTYKYLKGYRELSQDPWGLQA